MRADIWYDIACPFCYLGNYNFQAALVEFPHKNDVNIMYHSYEINPDAPDYHGQSFFEELAEHKGEPIEKVKEVFMGDWGKRADKVDLPYNLEDVKPTNTESAQRLIQYAITKGKGQQMLNRLFKAYWVEGQLVSDDAVLADLATEVGLNADDVKIMLNTGKFTEVIEEDQNMAKEAGFKGVPTYIFDCKYEDYGSHTPEYFADLLKRLYANE